MKETKHTPGPWPIDWYVCREGKKELWRVPCSIGPVSVDHNHWAGNHLDVGSADAHLIAAAPDLLAALMMVLDDPQALDGRPRTAECVRAAFAKATGE